MKWGSIIGGMFSPVIAFLILVLKVIIIGIIVILISLLAYFFIRYRFNPLKLNAAEMRKPYIRNKYFNLFRWVLIDFLERDLRRGEFKEYGVTFFVGRQGTGKTISMVRYLEVIKEKFPNCLIVTNFDYYRTDHIMEDWNDLLTIENGTDGVVFAIDEIQSEYSAKQQRSDFPDDILSKVCQQRKQRVKIVCTAQFFSRVVKQLREQASTVVACTTYFDRLTRNKEYDALQYAMVIDNPNAVNKKLKPLKKSSFVQSDALRSCYDTYEVIRRMRKISER